MQELSDKIAAILVREDVEGLIALGAPNDEYQREAEIIAQALSKMSKEQANEASVASLVSLIWSKAFNLGEKELKIRLPSLRDVARQVVTVYQGVV